MPSHSALCGLWLEGAQRLTRVLWSDLQFCPFHPAFAALATCHTALVWSVHSKESLSLGCTMLCQPPAPRPSQHRPALAAGRSFHKKSPLGELPWPLDLGRDLRTVASLEMQLPQFHRCVQNWWKSKAVCAPEWQCPRRLHSLGSSRGSDTSLCSWACPVQVGMWEGCAGRGQEHWHHYERPHARP